MIFWDIPVSPPLQPTALTDPSVSTFSELGLKVLSLGLVFVVVVVDFLFCFVFVFCVLCVCDFLGVLFCFALCQGLNSVYTLEGQALCQLNISPAPKVDIFNPQATESKKPIYLHTGQCQSSGALLSGNTSGPVLQWFFLKREVTPGSPSCRTPFSGGLGLSLSLSSLGVL